ncbi:sensor histidine kinase [Halomontanus rarus]|uniref:sensor histidine kinase n=1 Tax=Halomontanus rarus TaxID=3034020 RepID=UPI0023E85547|nr:ATP-binding protein [Halovivax sp. TS33]
MNTIQLLVGDEGNRTAVRRLLEKHYEVDTDRTVRKADLYLVDDRTFPEYHTDLSERVEQSHPVFCPVVLVRREANGVQISLPNPNEREDPVLVDDIVDAPLDRNLLFRRLDTLLVRRRQSKDLMHYVSKLEKSNASLKQFAYAASHDLQEPLRMVSSYLQLIERRYGDALDDDGEEFLEYAVDGAERMRDMIEGLLEYSRVDTRGEMMETVDLNRVLEDAIANLQMKIEEYDATITSDSLPSVEGDGGQLRQLIQNLLSNAIEYSGEDPPRIHVSAERVGTEWQISVRDDGIGIDPDDQNRIFDVFQRLHNHDEHPGTGIGLALCQRIVDRHDGRIWVDSTVGEGSTFTFTLPVAADPGP